MTSDTIDLSKQTPSNSLHMPNAAAAQLQPELLRAAKRGDWSRLGDLRSEEELAFVPEVVVDIDVDSEPPAAKKWTHAYGPGSVLHVVAAGGEDDAFLTGATEIYGKAKHLLADSCDAKGDTPLHCAARSGSVKMLSSLVDLAGSRVQTALRKRNRSGETVLHEAVRWADEEMVRVLVSADAGLARVPRGNSASPLYLAILLGHDGIAELLHAMDDRLSYSGPDGQNALHVAVLRSEKMTKNLLAWNNNLTKQGDGSTGRTPLHYAASRNSPMSPTVAKLLLEADESSAYQSDNNGSFPIHAAASGKNTDFIRVLLQRCPDCAQLRDGRGRTFLHIAVENDPAPFRSLLPLKGNQVRRFAAILNAQDDEGSTVLHLAVKAGRPLTIYPLMWSKEVQLNLQNQKGQTALDLSLSKKPSGVFYDFDPNLRIHDLLISAGANYGVQRGGEKARDPPLDPKVEAKKIKDSTTTIGVVSVLIITISFAAAFQLPGGYTSDRPQKGTPELAKKYSFEAFLIANNLALLCATMATISLMYAGVSIVDINTRMIAFFTSIFFLNSSARSLAAAFVFGTQAVLAPVDHAASVVTWLAAGLILLDIAWFTCNICLEHIVLKNRLGTKAYIRAACSLVSVPLGALWPYVVVGSFVAYVKTHRIH